jgi:citrate lyase subunit beta/citryl-CoA lyase
VTSLRRSCLAVPGSNERFIEKAAASAADQVFLDLEDACAPAEKERARGIVATALQERDFGSSARAVRVNDVTTKWCYEDIVEVVSRAGAHLDVLIIPKVEDESHVHFVDHLLSGLESKLGLERRIGLELQIESPKGATNLRGICAASRRTGAVIFGPGDYAASLGIHQPSIGVPDERYQGDQWHWVMSEIANHAVAAGLQAIDGPYADFRDAAGFHAAAMRAKLLGFTGKWCIHPDQIVPANEVFSPTADECQDAARIVAVYEDGVASGRGAIAVDGRLIDEATSKIAAATLARCHATGAG